jgi:hypothetical protein
MTHLVGKLDGRKGYVLLLSEPNIKNKKLQQAPRGSVVYPSVFAEKQRVCLVASKGLLATEVVELTSRDCVAVACRISGKDSLLVSFYCDIQGSIPEHPMIKCLEYAERNSLAILLGGDSNAHSSLYGNNTNRRGDKMEDIIFTHNLKVENKISHPTFQTHRANKELKSWIDVTLSRGMEGMIKDWIVDDSYNASDHNTIKFRVEGLVQTKKEMRAWNKADWEIFRAGLEKEPVYMPADITKKKLDKMVACWHKKILKHLDKVCPVKTANTTSPKGVWYTKDLRKMGRKVENLYLKMKQRRNLQNINRYLRARKEYKKSCSKERNASWRKYKESMQKTKDIASLTKKL